MCVLTLDLGHKAQAPLQVGADGVDAPAELRVEVGLAGATGVVAGVQLVTAARHGRDAQVQLAGTWDTLIPTHTQTHTPAQTHTSAKTHTHSSTHTRWFSHSLWCAVCS